VTNLELGEVFHDIEDLDDIWVDVGFEGEQDVDEEIVWR
jgi:hypothetical protein